MAKNDIRIWRTLTGAPAVAWFPIAAAATCVAGEPVRLNNAGELVECANDPATGKDILGILMSSGDTVGATDANGTFRWLSGAFTPGTGFPVSADLVPVALPSPTTWFITNNYDSTTGGFGDAPTKAATVADTVGLQVASGSWGVALGATNMTCRALQVLDVNFNDIAFSGGTGVYVVFTINASQTMADAVIADAGA